MTDKPTIRLVSHDEHGYAYQCEGQGAKQTGRAHPNRLDAQRQAFVDWQFRMGEVPYMPILRK